MNIYMFVCFATLDLAEFVTEAHHVIGSMVY
jgi:hypothetical protein